MDAVVATLVEESPSDMSPGEACLCAVEVYKIQ